MNFDLDDDQRVFAEAARDFFTGTASPADARKSLDGDAPTAPGRQAIADIGFYGITVPEAAGGAGQSVLDLAVVAEQAGRVLAGPSLVTAARASVLLEGDDKRLAGLADGSVSYAVVDAPGAPALDAATATRFLSRDGDDLVLSSGTVTVGDPIDPTRGLGTVELTDSEVIASGIGERWDRAERVARIILAAEGLGAAARAVEMGVAYAKEREAFGRQIGSYQAIKHMLVDSFVGVEQLRSLVWWAAWTADESAAELPLAAASAKASAAGVLEQAAETLIQVHGGIGFTWEHDAHLYWRRAKVDRLLLGDAASAFDEVARLALASAPTNAPDPAPVELEPTTAS
ncbi:acyl-CoA dehydrogenase family protein [Rhodococcus sp. X156]|uniref:acyl-CoA dehydrogenase family protein n=1 Tax=Rhodococcus sp. X156 TaxID=2499145 RepID=UPI000FDC5E5A|nr:acyl-CoA dehydrogenase family protein [Rhodococcus sp. X156]